MKHCPFCEAKIEDNARFCLYCMTSLTPKKTIAEKPRGVGRFVLLGAGLMAFVLAAAGLTLLLFRSGPSRPSLEHPPQTSGQTEPRQTTVQTQPEETEETAENPIPSDTSPEDTQPEPHQDPEDTKPSSTTPATLPSPTTPTPTVTTPTVPPATVPPATVPETESTTPAKETPPYSPYWTYGNGIPGTPGYLTYMNYNLENGWYAPEETPEVYGAYLNVAAPNTDVCTYRNATEKDVPDSAYLDGVVANGLNGFIPSGIYRVSDYRNGRPVVAIAPFYNITPRSDIVMLTVGENVVSILPYALHNCCEFKYLCVEGELINIDVYAFPPYDNRYYQIVIRCSATCKNSDGEYIKDIVGRYAAVWEEWNG